MSSPTSNCSDRVLRRRIDAGWLHVLVLICMAAASFPMLASYAFAQSGDRTETKLKLETMTSGQVLEVLLRDGEPLMNVPKSIKAEGHKILAVSQEGSFFKLLIERR